MSNRKKTSTSIFIYKGRLLFVIIALCVVFSSLMGRLYFLHIQRSDESIQAVDKARKIQDVVFARRGNIVDSKDNLLATSRPVVTLACDPERVPLDKDSEPKLRNMADILNIDFDELKALYTPNQDLEKIEKVKENLTDRQLTRLRSIGLMLNMTREELIRKSLTKPNSNVKLDYRLDQIKNNPNTMKELASILNITIDELSQNFPSYSVRWKKIVDELDFETYQKIQELKIDGIVANRKYIRVYPSKNLMAHVVGFVNKEFVSQLGIEKQFDYYLKGQDGWIESERDGHRKELAQYRTRDIAATDGLNIELSIDSIIQEITHRELSNIVRKYNPSTATIIVSEPSTGFILAMSSYPTFDPNNYNKVDEDALRNRAICDQYEPGSTFKIVPISAALNESLVGPEDKFDCNAATALYKGKQVRLPKEAHTMKTLSVRDITKKSSNKGVAQLGIKLGDEKLYDYAYNFGYGQKTNIGLTGEISGTLHKPGTKDWDGLTITRMPMGHAVAATPLQVHLAMASIANQGVYMQPQLVKRVFDNKNDNVITYSPIAVRRVITPKIATLMSEMLAEVVTDTGTARRAQIKGFRVAGKTGTSQKIINGKYSNRHHVASFSGFFPAQRPRLVITVVVDTPHLENNAVGYGGVVAAPAFQNVAQQIAHYLGIQSDNDHEKMVAWK